MHVLLFASHLMATMDQAPATVHTVPAVDLDRYAGDWFEVARYPNRFDSSRGSLPVSKQRTKPR